MTKEVSRHIGGLLDKTKELVDKSLTGTKPIYIADTETHLVDGYAIKFLSDTEFTTLSVDTAGAPPVNDMSSEAGVAGDVWYVPVKAIALTSGSVLVYSHKKR